MTTIDQEIDNLTGSEEKPAKIELIQLELDDMRGTIPPIGPSHGCIIAGGAVRRWFNGKEELSDVDVFAPSAEQHVEFLKDKKATKVDEHANADTYTIDGVKVQLIKLYHPSMESLLGSFDFNVCQFAWDERGIFTTKAAITGVLRGHLRVVNINREYALDSLRRAFKYQSRGYHPCAGTLRDIANSLRNLTEEEVEKQVTVSP
jgi:hypothetical protein